MNRELTSIRWQSPTYAQWNILPCLLTPSPGFAMWILEQRIGSAQTIRNQWLAKSTLFQATNVGQLKESDDV